MFKVEADAPITVTVKGGPVGSVDGGTSVTTGIERSVGKGKRKPWVIASLSVGAASAALYGGAVASRLAFDDQESDDLYRQTNTLYWGSVAGGATAGGLMVVALAMPTK